MPISSARVAETFSPSIIRAVARGSPISRGRKKVPPLSGTSPTLQKDWIKEAFAEAITRSHARAMLAPDNDEFRFHHERSLVNGSNALEMFEWLLAVVAVMNRFAGCRSKLAPDFRVVRVAERTLNRRPLPRPEWSRLWNPSFRRRNS